MIESQSQYPYQHWMEDIATEHAMDILGDSVYTKTIFDIIFPGASKAGMNFVNYNDDEHMMANDQYSDLLSSVPIQQKKLWTERQKSSIYTLLMSGARFFDLRFQYELHQNDQEYYCHNGLLGQPLLQILDQILSFISNVGTKEIIVIYLNDFVSSSSDTNDLQLTGLFDKIIEHPLINNIADSIRNDIRLYKYRDFVENNINIIIFTDQYPTDIAVDKSKYFYNGLLYLHQTENLNYDRNEVSYKINAILSGLSGGWNKDRLNLIYWTLDNNNSSFMQQRYIFDSYYDFSYDLMKELHSTLSSYNKLYFGNVILIDFFELTDIMEQVLTLNYKYFECNDKDKDLCPIITDLPMEYNDNTISNGCNTDLQQLCKRSCGVCPIIHGNPGDECLTNKDCISPLYTMYSQSNIGECFISDYNNKTKSFCLVPNAIESCDIYQDGTCYSTFDCKGSCIVDYQCQTGYCYTIDSVCMSINDDDNEQNQEIIQQHYDPIQSTEISIYLKDLEPFRSKGYNLGIHQYGFQEMECNNDINDVFDCILSNKNSNEYISSLVGIMLIPFILSLVMFSIYCCIWPWFCFCEETSKKCCCLTLIGHPQSGTCLCHWIIYGILSVFSIIILYASIDIIMNNAEINDNLFGEQDSVQYTAIKLLDQIHDEFSEFGNKTQVLIQNIDGYLFNVEQLSQRKNNITNNNGNSFLSELENMKTNYNQKLTLHAMVQNPLQIEKNVNFSIDCLDCFDISYKIELIENEFNETMIEIINELNKVINGTMNFQNVIILSKQNINNLWNIFAFYVNMSKEMRNSTTMYLEYGEELDSKYKGIAIIAISTFVFILVIMPIFGVLIAKYSAWFFKINWCCAMWLGSLLMFIMSWSLLITTGFADFCIRLDSFETEMVTSDLGYLWNIDNSTSLLLNTCFTGKSIHDTFDTYILDWNQWKNQLNDVLTIDMSDYIMLSELQNFIIYTNNMNNLPETDRYIFIANNIGNYCGYNKPNVTFKRDNLFPFDDANMINYTYWDHTIFVDNGLCLEAYFNASYMVQTEYLLNSEIKSLISLLQMASNNLLYEYEKVMYSINLILKQELKNISCRMRPIFNSMDEILYNFSNCGSVGKTYQDFKETTCISMWNNSYNILRNLIILAFITIPIVLLSLCLDFMYDPKVDISEINEEKNMRNASVEETEKQDVDEKEKKSKLSVVRTTKKEKKSKRVLSNESNDGFISVDGSIRSKSSKNKIVELSVIKYTKISNMDAEFEDNSILKQITTPTPIPVAIPENIHYNIHDVNGSDDEKEAINNNDNNMKLNHLNEMNVEMDIMDNKEKFIRVNNMDEYNLSYHTNNSREDANDESAITEEIKTSHNNLII